MKATRTSSRQIPSKAASGLVRIKKMAQQPSAQRGKFVVFSSNLKPKHLTERQIERAVEAVVASRKTY